MTPLPALPPPSRRCAVRDCTHRAYVECTACQVRYCNIDYDDQEDPGCPRARWTGRCGGRMRYL